MQGNQSRQVILEKANRPVHDSEVAGQEGSTEPGGQSRPTTVVAVQQKVEWGGIDGGCPLLTRWFQTLQSSRGVVHSTGGSGCIYSGRAGVTHNHSTLQQKSCCQLLS